MELTAFIYRLDNASKARMDREHIPHPRRECCPNLSRRSRGAVRCSSVCTRSGVLNGTQLLTRLSLFSYFYRRYPPVFPCPTNATTSTNAHLSRMLAQLQHLCLKSSFLPPYVLIEPRQLAQEGYCLSGDDKFVASRPMPVVSRTSWFTRRQSSSSSTTANSSSHVGIHATHASQQISCAIVIEASRVSRCQRAQGNCRITRVAAECLRVLESPAVNRQFG
jgi:hypothetical protein